MKKLSTNSFIFILLVYAYGLNAQADFLGTTYQELLYKTNGADSIISEQADLETGKVDFVNLDKFSYDSKCKISKRESKSWNTVQKKWIDSLQAVYNYDAQGRLTSILTQNLRGSTWKDSLRTNYAYTGSATQETSQTFQILRGTTWTNDTQKEFTYTTSKKVATITEKEWNGTAWVNVRRESNTYNAQNRLTTLIKENWTGTAWANSSRELFSFDTQSRLKEFKTETWNSATTKWDSAAIVIVKATPNSLSSTINLKLIDLPIDVEFIGTPTGFLDRINAKILGQTLARIRFTYNAACQVTATEDLVQIKDAFSISPNPAADLITIKLDEVEGNSFSARIINSSGQLLHSKTLEGTDNHQIDISQLTNGLYIISVQGERWQSTKKFIVQH
jgi:hypothetical protein